MSGETLNKEQVLRDFAAAYERAIETAEQVAQRGTPQGYGAWGPREVVAHLAGWELMANVRVPAILGGLRPPEFDDPAQATLMNEAINTAFVTLAAEQSVERLSGILRRAYQRTAAILTQVDPAAFRPGEYVYERTRGVIEHCQEHIDLHLSSGG
jgi:hypothetical protein